MHIKIKYLSFFGYQKIFVEFWISELNTPLKYKLICATIAEMLIIFSKRSWNWHGIFRESNDSSKNILILYKQTAGKNVVLIGTDSAFWHSFQTTWLFAK